MCSILVLVVLAAYLRSTTIVTRLTEHDDVIKLLLRGAPRPGLALGPASARCGPGSTASISARGKGKISLLFSLQFHASVAALSLSQGATSTLNTGVNAKVYQQQHACDLAIQSGRTLVKKASC